MKRGKTMYNYLENVINDVMEAIKENYSEFEIAEKLVEDRDGFAETLNNDLWIDDSVTGNASGSYTFNSFTAADNLVGNEDLVEEVISEFGIDQKTIADHFMAWEYWDVTIRCYLLGQAIEQALDNMEEDETISEIMEQIENGEEE